MKKLVYFSCLVFLSIGFLIINAQEEKPLTVVFLGESSATDDVWLYRIQIMKEAAQKLGIDFSYNFAEGDYSTHAAMIEDAINKDVDAIIGPWWHATIYNDAIIKAVKHGIFVYGLLGIEPRYSLDSDIVTYLGWSEINWHDFGKQLAAIAFNNVSSNSTILWPAETTIGNYITDGIEGFKEYYMQHGLIPKIQIVEVGFDTAKAVKILKDYLTTHSFSAIITTGAIAINAANIAVKQMKLSPNTIKLIGQAVTPAAIEGIREDYMPAGVNLELTDSSYYALLDVIATVKLGAKPRHSSVGFSIVTKDLILDTNHP